MTFANDADVFEGAFDDGTVPTQELSNVGKFSI